jgi:hypothetical protein
VPRDHILKQFVRKWEAKRFGSASPKNDHFPNAVFDKRTASAKLSANKRAL